MGVTLSSYQAFTAALSTAHSVRLTAYTLGSGETERALIAAAAHGAEVRVSLPQQVYDDPSGGIAKHNANEIAILNSHGIQAQLIDNTAMHLKAAVIDGSAFYDDRNWCNGDDLIVDSTNPQDIVATTNALAGGPASVSTDEIALTKGAAIAQEAQLLTTLTGPIMLETENLSTSYLTTLLRELAAHTPMRILVKTNAQQPTPRLAKLLAALQANGAVIHTTNENDKFCLVGDQAWIGSANASGGDPNMSDWGARITDPGSIAQIRSRFEKAWIHSRPTVIEPPRQDPPTPVVEKA